jgi:hypothetical protein
VVGDGEDSEGDLSGRVGGWVGGRVVREIGGGSRGTGGGVSRRMGER